MATRKNTRVVHKAEDMFDEDGQSMSESSSVCEPVKHTYKWGENRQTRKKSSPSSILPAPPSPLPVTPADGFSDNAVAKFCCGYAKSNQAKCHHAPCNNKIALGQLRIARCAPADSTEQKHNQWFHFPCFFAHQTKEGLNRGLTSAADLYCADADRAKPEWVGDSHMILGCINTPPKLKKSVLGIPLKQKKAKKVAVPVAMDMPAPIVAEDANAEVGWQRLCLISHNGCTMALPKSQGGIDEDDEGAEKEEMEAEEDSDEELGGQSHHPVSSSSLKSPSPFLFEDQLANTATSNWPVFDEFYNHLGADIVGIQEARVPGQERMDHKSAKFVYFFSGPPAGAKRNFGVGLAVRRKWAAYTQVVYVSDRIIWARIQLGAQLLFVVCAYAPS